MNTPSYIQIILNTINHIPFFSISIPSLNLFSIMIGVFISSNTWWRIQAMNYVVYYLIAVAAYFYLKSTL